MENNIILGITSVPSAEKQSSSGRRRRRSISRVSPRGQYQGGGVYILNERHGGRGQEVPALRLQAARGADRTDWNNGGCVIPAVQVEQGTSHESH